MASSTKGERVGEIAAKGGRATFPQEKSITMEHTGGASRRFELHAQRSRNCQQARVARATGVGVCPVRDQLQEHYHDLERRGEGGLISDLQGKGVKKIALLKATMPASNLIDFFPAVPRANRAQVVSVLSFCRFVRIPQSTTHCDDHQQVTGCLGILVETMPQPSIAHD
jgi:hypothetical protein